MKKRIVLSGLLAAALTLSLTACGGEAAKEPEEIPEEAEMAFTQLKREYPGMVREANPLYASADPRRF